MADPRNVDPAIVDLVRGRSKKLLGGFYRLEVAWAIAQVSDEFRNEDVVGKLNYREPDELKNGGNWVSRELDHFVTAGLLRDRGYAAWAKVEDSSWYWNVARTVMPELERRYQPTSLREVDGDDAAGSP